MQKQNPILRSKKSTLKSLQNAECNSFWLFQDISEQFCVFISETVTNEFDVALLNKARLDTPQECSGISSPRNFVPSILPSIWKVQLEGNADRRDINEKPNIVQTNVSFMLHILRDVLSLLVFVFWSLCF